MILPGVDPADIRKTIEQMRELLRDPPHWCKHTAARDVAGLCTYYNLPEAYSYCLTGALDKVCGGPHFSGHLIGIRQATWQYLRSRVNQCLKTWNDRSYRTHQEVLDLLDLALYSL